MGCALDLRHIMEFRKLGLPFAPPGPFWFEDLMFFVVDESRRMPARVAAVASRIRRLPTMAIEKATEFDPAELWRHSRPEAAPAMIQHRETPPLDEPESWALATEPLVAAETGLRAVVGSHAAAAEQLDSLTYVLARMRDDLRPIMTYARLEDENNVEALPDPKALETSIEALLELSRTCAATRPKDRVHVAA